LIFIAVARALVTLMATGHLFGWWAVSRRMPW